VTAFTEVVGFVRWEDDELLELVWPTPTDSDLWPLAMKHAEPDLRALPDGSPQLTLRNSTGARVVRLGAEPAHVVVSTPASITDAVLTPEGSVVVLEKTGNNTFTVRHLTPDGTTTWTHSYSGKPGGHDGVRYHSRLLIDSRGQVFVSTRGSLIRVNDTESTTVAEWSGMNAVSCPDGRIGYARTREWVVLDLDTSEETVVEPNEALDDVIGVDAEGRVYWRSFGKIARMTPDGDIDWQVTSRGIAVSEEFGATILTTDDNEFGDDLGRLAGRGDDGGYVFYQAVQGSYGKLSHVDQHGRLLRTEPAPEDIWLTMDTAQRPGFSSVTPDGAVLVAVRSKLGVHVVAVKEGRWTWLRRGTTSPN
jgi:hypothetical protein